MKPIIKVENLSKQYRLGTIGTGTVRDDFQRWLYRIQGKEDPFLKIGETNDRSAKGKSDYVWALKDINFEVMPGEVLGIIGKNGAGKSTLLKILSKVTGPTTGRIDYNGRIGSLLEVGTGFHPELTGRENIFLNGAILGMTKREIKAKLDEIIDFSGCERYIDTPVKRYSSGMTVRLGFAVAAHLDPEILVVDEVLAVGDAEFQKKAIGKMQDVSRNHGRTVLFVSHNMTAIENLCNKICFIDKGSVNFIGDVNVGLHKYFETVSIKKLDNIEEQIKNLPKNKSFKFESVYIEQNNSSEVFLSNKTIEVRFLYRVQEQMIGLRIGFDIINAKNSVHIFRTFHDDMEDSVMPIDIGLYQAQAEIPANLLLSGSYLLNVSIGLHQVKWLVYESVSVPIEIHNINGVNKLYADNRPGVVSPLIGWKIFKRNG